MKVLLVSDNVSNFVYNEGLKETFSDIELVLSCGDLPYPYLEFIISILNVPLLYVLGNHDHEYRDHADEVQHEPQGGCDIDGKTMWVSGRKNDQNGLLIGGLQGTRCFGENQAALNESGMKKKVWAMKPRLAWNQWRHGRAIDILLTHAPPFGIHDAAGGDDLCHTGYQTFLHLMEKYRPRYLIHGHTHPTYGFDDKPQYYEDTQVINVYGYKVLELDTDVR